MERQQEHVHTAHAALSSSETRMQLLIMSVKTPSDDSGKLSNPSATLSRFCYFPEGAVMVNLCQIGNEPIALSAVMVK